ncbi:MAG: hypothetical protein H6Q00_1818 [Holophagaceae bacterium]|nr:hypothetical protein [Holophagaceae bacterium]
MLSEEIEVSQRLVRTDAYQMSIGEIVNMYKDGELVINPDFQRLYRWDASQKSRLIESILLGIPLPPIFVFERENAKWELIDGLQRLSTILEFMGILRDQDGELRPPSYLEATKYLPSLHNTVWEYSPAVEDLSTDQQVELDKTAQLSVRRARLGVEILKRPSDNKTKFDLFQRLNSGGTPANPQEIRNCVIIMVNPEYYKFIRELASLEDFRKVIALTEEQEDRQKHMEYLSRFLSHTYTVYDEKLDVEEFIDEALQSLSATGETIDAKLCFEFTFRVLNEALGSNALRRHVNGQPSGRIGLVAFECIAVGIGKNYKNIQSTSDPVSFVKQRIFDLWESPDITALSASGLRGTTRISRSVPLGAQWFKP